MKTLFLLFCVYDNRTYVDFFAGNPADPASRRFPDQIHWHRLTVGSGLDSNFSFFYTTLTHDSAYVYRTNTIP